MIIKDIIFYFVSCFLILWFNYSFPLFIFTPDFIFIALFISNIIFPPKKVLFFSFLLGLFSDFYSLGPFGLFALIYVSLSYLVILIKDRLNMNSFIPRNILFLILSFFNLLIYMFIYSLILKEYPYGFKILFFQPIVNLLFFEIYFQIVKAFYKRGIFSDR